MVSHTEGGRRTENVGKGGAEKIFGPKSDEVAGENRRLQNDKLFVLYFS